jgi:ATPase subunit of ABC transporter with duplicated ATPase domains
VLVAVLLSRYDVLLLDEVATSVVELDLAQQRIGHCAGNYTDFGAGRGPARRQAHESDAAYRGAPDALAAQARRREEWAAKGQRRQARRRARRAPA